MQQGVCGVSIQLRTPKKRRRETAQWKRKSAIEAKNVEVYSREKNFSPTSVVIKTNPLFRSSSSATPHRLPTNFKVTCVYMHSVWDNFSIIILYVNQLMQGELQLNVHQQSYIAKTKEQEMVNAIIQLAKYGKKKIGMLSLACVSLVWHSRPLQIEEGPCLERSWLSLCHDCFD